MTQRYAYETFSEFGRTDLGLQVLLQRQFPSVANWINQGAPAHPEIGATTLWETWGSNATGPCSMCPDSFNHIMWGTFGAWLYSDVAGLGHAAGGNARRGWKSLFLKPAAFAHADVTYASASVDTPIGLASISWYQEPQNLPVWYGKASQGTPSVSALTLVCRSTSSTNAQRAAFTGVTFAAFGSPTGDSPGAYNRSVTCDHPNATVVVAALCVGRSTCTIPLGTTAFGSDSKVGAGSDWCPKPLGPLTLAVAMDHNGCDATVVLTTTGSVPAGGRATFALPIGAHASSESVSVIEGSNATVVFEGGTFVVGAATGIAAARMNQEDRHVYIETGSGTYNFSVLAQGMTERIPELLDAL